MESSSMGGCGQGGGGATTGRNHQNLGFRFRVFNHPLIETGILPHLRESNRPASNFRNPGIGGAVRFWGAQYVRGRLHANDCSSRRSGFKVAVRKTKNNSSAANTSMP